MNPSEKWRCSRLVEFAGGVIFSWILSRHRSIDEPITRAATDGELTFNAAAEIAMLRCHRDKLLSGENAMNKIALFPIAVTLAAAYAFADTPKDSPKMTFRDVKAEPQMSAIKDKVTPYRSEELVLVIIKDTVLCGQKATNASFAIKGNEIALHYELTAAPSGATTKCTLASEFKIENVPHKDLTVSFSGGPEAATVALMQKCPNYNPKTDDVWECLVPAEKK
jgi:hypothetical protein